MIIQSLRPDEKPQSGTELYEYLTTNDEIPVAVSLHEPKTADQLMTLLEDAALRAQAGGWIPLIHFEMHGAATKNALVTASGESITWGDVASPLRHINLAVRNSLIVVLGVCSGAYIGTAAANSPFEPSPFTWLVGPDRPVIGFFLPIGFKAFYKELIETGDFVKAVGRLRQHTLPEYTALDIATWFRKSREVYEATQTRGPILKERVKRIFRARRAALVAQYGSNNKARAALAAIIQDTSSRWPDYYRHFVMADIYPENEKRFPQLGGA